MDTDEESLLRATIAEVTASADGLGLTSALDQFGWREMLATDPGTAIPAVFQGQGAAGTWSSALHDVLGSALDLEADTVVLIPLPGHRYLEERGAPSIEIRGLMLGERPGATTALAMVGEPHHAPTLVRASMSELAIERVSGLDPAICASLVTGTTSDGQSIEPFGDASRWECALADGWLAVSHQLIGTIDAMETLALSHAFERYQFGRQIGSFQAVRHRLAETRVAVEAARAAAGAAGPMRRRSSDERANASLASMLAKLIAGRSSIKVTAHCQQVLAGIGFTAEHPFHRFMKRAVVLEKVLGDTSSLTESLGRQLVALGEAPRVVDL
jgi:hypothetical protein